MVVNNYACPTSVDNRYAKFWYDIAVKISTGTHKGMVRIPRHVTADIVEYFWRHTEKQAIFRVDILLELSASCESMSGESNNIISDILKGC